MMEELIQLAGKQQRYFDAATCPRTKKERGHFGTPLAIADFMAGMFTQVPHDTVRILDPGAGVGTLSAAVCQRVLRQRSPRRLVFELWENDPNLEALLYTTMDRCREVLRAGGHEMEFTIRTEDYVLEHAQPSLFNNGPTPSFDLVIMNPPYYKVRKDSAHASVMEHVVHGQPNIYVLFMAAAVDLLTDGGEMVAITPRSYFNGPYFKRFRKWFFDRMVARQVHVFESRADAFKDDEVLQENVILLAERGGGPKDVTLTSSAGRQFHHVERHTVPYAKVVEDTTGDHLIRVATSLLDREVIEALDALPHRFHELGFAISTGPVVTFRSTEFLRDVRSDDTAPLLWMHNVRPFITQFPPKKNGKPTHILVSDRSMRLLLPAKRYVLLKRFTAKEERRRLVAGIVGPEDSYSEFVGLENHLNYVYRPSGELTEEESLGLAAFFNSAFVDRYFRAISGSTQVNASEIRAMPIPCETTIRQIGQLFMGSDAGSSILIERTVAKTVGLSEGLIQELCESVQ